MYTLGEEPVRRATPSADAVRDLPLVLGPQRRRFGCEGLRDAVHSPLLNHDDVLIPELSPCSPRSCSFPVDGGLPLVDPAKCSGEVTRAGVKLERRHSRLRRICLTVHRAKQAARSVRSYLPGASLIKTSWRRAATSSASETTSASRRRRGRQSEVEECVVCWGLLDGGALPLECGHSQWHGPCIQRWLRFQGSCPVCRSGATHSAEAEAQGSDQPGGLGDSPGAVKSRSTHVEWFEVCLDENSEGGA